MACVVLAAFYHFMLSFVRALV